MRIRTSTCGDPRRNILSSGRRLALCTTVVVHVSYAIITSVSHLEGDCVELLPAMELDGYSPRQSFESDN